MAPTTVNAGPRLDRLPISGWHYKVLALVAAGIMVDLFELYSGGSILAALVGNGWSSVALNARFLAVTFMGMLLGAWLSGIAGDAFGRRFCYRANLLVFGLASIAAAAAPNMNVLITLRFFMGLGLGAEVVVGYAALAEFLPASHRGRLVAAVAVFANCGFFLSLAMAYFVIPTLGWRWMFLIPGIVALGVWYARRAMPESPRWLESKGRMAEAEQLLRSIETQVTASAGSIPAYAPAMPVRTKHVPFSALFSARVRRSTSLGMLINVVVGFSLYGFLQWLPTVFVERGMSLGGSLLTTMVIALGQTSGSVVSILLSDRLGRKPSIVVFSAAAACIGFGVIFTSGVGFLVGGFLLAVCLGVANTVAFTVYVPELFETRLRLRGAGFCGAVGRAATSAMQFGIVPLLAWGGLEAITGALAFVLLLQAVAVGLFGPETKQRPLDSEKGELLVHPAPTREPAVTSA